MFLSQMAHVSSEDPLGTPPDLVGVDIRPEAARAARRRVPNARITTANFLLHDPPPPKRYDIIVGNPPYLGQRDVTQLAYAAPLLKRFGLNDDLYVYFLRRSLELLVDGGVLAMVTSDSWLTLPGKETLRRELLRHRIDQIVRLPERILARRIPACCFTLVKAAMPAAVRVRDAGAHDPSDATFEPSPGRRVPQSTFIRSPRAMLFDPTPENLRLNRICGRRLTRWLPGPSAEQDQSISFRSSNVVPLHRVAKVNDVGIHSRNCRHRLFFARKTRPGLRRLLQGRQIEPWIVRWNSPAARFRWVDVDYCPRPGVKGIGRGGQPARRDEYWDFQGDPAVHRLPERILIRQTGDAIVAAYLRQDRHAHYTDNTLFTCLLTNGAKASGLTYRYLLGYLNSAATSRIYRFLSQEQGRRQAQIKIGLLRMLPFRVPSPEEIHEIDALVAEILKLRQANRAGESEPLIAQCDAHFEALLDAC